MRVWLFPWLSYLTIGAMVAVLVAMAVTPGLASQFYFSLLTLAVVVAAWLIVRRPPRTMNLLHRFIKGVDALNDWIGRTVAWLTLGCVLTCFTVVVLRYAFNVGFPWMQELYVWQHAAVFMAGAGYTMLHRGHVNVDVMYGRLGDRGQGVDRHPRHPVLPVSRGSRSWR